MACSDQSVYILDALTSSTGSISVPASDYLQAVQLVEATSMPKKGNTAEKILRALREAEAGATRMAVFRQ